MAILGTIDSKHNQEVINCSTSYDMWRQLQTYHEHHSEESVVHLQEKYYNTRLGDNESIAVFISTLQRLAKQLSDLGQTITEHQIISKIRCGLPRYMILSFWLGIASRYKTSRLLSFIADL